MQGLRIFTVRLMNELQENLLNEIYYRTAQGAFATLDELITHFGSPGSDLRPLLEDLKEGGFIVEHPEGFQISDHGRNTARSQWR